MLSYTLKAAYVKVDLFLYFTVVLRIFIQVVPQKLRDNKEVLFVVEVVNQLE